MTDQNNFSSFKNVFSYDFWEIIEGFLEKIN